jgi:hypothetical protein
MELSAAELADVIDDPFVRREIMRALDDAEATGSVDPSDAELLLEHDKLLLLLDSPEIDATLLAIGSELALLKLMAKAQ